MELPRKEPPHREDPQEALLCSLLHHVGIPPVGVFLWLGGQDPCACHGGGQRQRSVWWEGVCSNGDYRKVWDVGDPTWPQQGGWARLVTWI